MFLEVPKTLPRPLHSFAEDWITAVKNLEKIKDKLPEIFYWIKTCNESSSSIVSELYERYGIYGETFESDSLLNCACLVPTHPNEDIEDTIWDLLPENRDLTTEEQNFFNYLKQKYNELFPVCL